MTDTFATLTRDLPWLRALAVRLARGDEDEADDLVQASLQSAWHHAPPAEDLHAPRGWLATVLRNHLRMARRSDARRAAREIQAVPEPTLADAPAPIDVLARIELLGFVMERLRALPDIDQRIISMRYLDELDASVIGERLSLPAATVRSRLQRALGRLRAEVDAHFGGDRSAWALLLGLPMPTGGGTTNTTIFGAITSMTIAAKIAVATAVSAVAFTLWFAGRDAPSAAAHDAVITAGPSDTAQARDTAVPAERAWAARRTAIRAKIGARRTTALSPILAPDDEALIEQARAAMSEAFIDCTDDGTRAIEGSMVVRATIIGGADIGTIFESIEPLDGSTRDASTLECLIESSYAFVGAAPTSEIDTTFTIAWLGAQPGNVEDDAWRREMFDAAVTSHLAELRACEGDEPPARGVLRLDFEFGDGPAPITVRAQDSELDQELISCVIAVAQTWMFPRKFAGRTMTSMHTFPIDPAVDGPDRRENPE